MHTFSIGGQARRFALYALSAVLLSALPLPGTAFGAPAARTAPVSSDRVGQPAKYPAVIGRAELRAAAPLLRSRPAAEAGWRSLAADQYPAAGGSLKLFAHEGGWLHAKLGSGSGWIPAWYTSGDAAKVEYVPAVRLTAPAGAKLYLSPGSEESWVYDGDPLVSALRFGDWYGVSPDTGRSGSRPGSHAMLLWIKANDASNVEPLEQGLLAPDSGLSLNTVRAALDGLLHAGMPEREVRRMLGEPVSVTDARMLPPGDMGTDGKYRWRNGGSEWRYERQDAHFLVRLSEKDNKLIGANWILPLTDYDQQLLRPWWLQEGEFDTLYKALPLLPSLKPEIEWRTKMDTDYAYLDSVDDNVLLVLGDDGGFSGFHYSSLLYALDQNDGKVRWEKDLGKEAPASVSDSADEDPQGYAHIRPQDGKALWTYAWPGLSSPQAYTVGDAVILSSGTSSNRSAGALIALDEKTGQKRWKQQVSEPFGVLNRDSGDPYVLLAQGRTLRALDPSDGRTVWSGSFESGSIDAGESRAYDPAAVHPFAEPDGTRWIKVDGEGWRKIDLEDGRTLARYAMPDELDSGSFEDLGSDRLLVAQPNPDIGNGRPDARDFTTTLLDASDGSVLWTFPGKIEHGRIESGTLYAVANGIPAALSLESGRTVWQARTNGMVPNLNFTYGAGHFTVLGDYLLLPYDTDLLAFHKKTGRLLGRIDGFRFGYPEMHGSLVRDSLLNEHNGKLYIGSASRSFSVLDTEKLIRLLDKALADGSGIKGLTPADREAEAAAWYPAEPY
ncbi:PQQ-binding-like beta-propeller repeat protein [Saccharibacillus deserti]|uniref:outer membrane protein assembly factor BamB family protein n=1 Tax=Saccharibacillus deserti TaxID=1634444 RepID=UPI001554873A|nr:PQQ-binding-like beta-propeller repeat protein [Saccharibacillus deserti]